MPASVKRKLQQAFAETVRYLRAHHPERPTQATLAERAGMDRTYLGQLERGERNVTLSNLWRIAQALGVSPSRFVSGVDKRYRRLGGEPVVVPETPIDRQMRHLRRYMDEGPTMKWLEDRQQRNVYVNRLLLEFLGSELEDLVGEGWKQKLHPEDRQRLQRERARGFRSRQAYVTQFRLLRPDGQYWWVVQQAAPQFTPKGEFVGFLGCIIEMPQPPRR